MPEHQTLCNLRTLQHRLDLRNATFWSKAQENYHMNTPIRQTI